MVPMLWSGVTRIPAITSGPDSHTSGNSRDTPAQTSHPPEDDSGAKSDPGGSNANLTGQADPTLSNDLGNDLASLLKDLTSGNTSAAKADVSKIQRQICRLTTHLPSPTLRLEARSMP
jgi:hypothetical protein